MLSVSFAALPVMLAEGSGRALGTMDYIFLGLWALFSCLYWSTYRKEENLLLSAAKVGALLGFVYGVIRGFDWLQESVPADQIYTFWGLLPAATTEGSRIPFMDSAFLYFVIALLLLVAWYSRRKFSTVCGVILSAWDRGHWYMLPVIFILMTVGLLLVAAAASPVLSPFIYTLF